MTHFERKTVTFWAPFLTKNGPKSDPFLAPFLTHFWPKNGSKMGHFGVPGDPKMTHF